MRHAGLLAHTPEGAALCYLEFCRLGGPSHPDITLDHVAFGRSSEAWAAGDLGAIRAILAGSVARLARAGAEFFFCPANTAHIALEAPGAPLAIPGLHIAEIVADEAAKNGWRKVGVLATRYTMESPLYERALVSRGLELRTPAPPDATTVHDLIFRELVHGVFTPEARALCSGIIDRLADDGCDAVALACTELPLLIAPSDSRLPTIDSTRLLARSALAAAVGAAPAPTWRGGV